MSEYNGYVRFEVGDTAVSVDCETDNLADMVEFIRAVRAEKDGTSALVPEPPKPKKAKKPEPKPEPASEPEPAPEPPKEEEPLELRPNTIIAEETFMQIMKDGRDAKKFTGDELRALLKDLGAPGVKGVKKEDRQVVLEKLGLAVPEGL